MMSTILGMLATGAFALIVLIFAATFAGVDAFRIWPNLAAWIHIAALALFALAIASASREFRRNGVPRSKQDPFAYLVLDCPRWVGPFAILIVLNAVICWAAMIVAGHGGGSEIVDGAYVLTHQGVILLHLTAAEYDAQVLKEHRGFASLIALFLFMPVSWFLLRTPYRPADAARS